MATSRVKPVSAGKSAAKPVADAAPVPVLETAPEPAAPTPVAAPAAVTEHTPAATAVTPEPVPVTAPVAAAKIALIPTAPVLKDVANKMEHAMQSTKENVEKASQAFFKGYDQLATLGKDNVDAVVKSGTIMAKGFEEMGRALMALTQANMEQAVAVAKASLTCTTLKQVVDLHSDYARTSFDKLMSEGNKLSELSIKVANEAVAPIQARVNVAVEKFAKPAA